MRFATSFTDNGQDGAVKIDATDQAIIAALKEDGRTPFAQIAQRLGVSTGMVRQRYQRLVKEGVLQVAAITNPMLLGYSTMALIGLKVESGLFDQVAEQLAQFPEVIYLVYATGSYDLLLEVICRDNDHLLEFLTRRLHAIEGIRETETFMYLKILKESYTLP